MYVIMTLHNSCALQLSVKFVILQSLLILSTIHTSSFFLYVPSVYPLLSLPVPVMSSIYASKLGRLLTASLCSFCFHYGLRVSDSLNPLSSLCLGNFNCLFSTTPESSLLNTYILVKIKQNYLFFLYTWFIPLPATSFVCVCSCLCLCINMCVYICMSACIFPCHSLI